MVEMQEVRLCESAILIRIELLVQQFDGVRVLGNLKLRRLLLNCRRHEFDAGSLVHVLGFRETLSIFEVLSGLRICIEPLLEDEASLRH